LSLQRTVARLQDVASSAERHADITVSQAVDVFRRVEFLNIRTQLPEQAASAITSGSWLSGAPMYAQAAGISFQQGIKEMHATSANFSMLAGSNTKARLSTGASSPNSSVYFANITPRPVVLV
jgi:hypothetical protein